MDMQDYTHSQTLTSQAELSRQAAHWFALETATREARRRRPRRPGPMRRLRHSLAGGLVATARLIDAT